MQLASVMAQREMPLSELRDIMHRYPQVMKNVHVADKALLATSSAVARGIKSAEDELGDEGRVLVRASGTEPVVRVMAEAETEEVAMAVVERLASVVAEELG